MLFFRRRHDGVCAVVRGRVGRKKMDVKGLKLGRASSRWLVLRLFVPNFYQQKHRHVKLVMAPAPPDLSAKYTVLQLSVVSSSSISNRTTSLISHIKSTPANSKPAVVALHAKAPVANKLISIVEIAKRELKESGQKVYQYNALSSELVQSTPAPKNAEDQDAMTDEEPAFEEIHQKSTVRNVPTMTTYLSLASIKELKQAYGYFSLTTI